MSRTDEEIQTQMNRHQEILSNNENNNINHHDDMFALLATRAAVCLVQSDLRRNSKKASSLTNWIDDASAFALEQTLNQARLRLPHEQQQQQQQQQQQDQAWSWSRWMKAVPTPIMVDVSSEFRQLVAQAIPSETMDLLLSSSTNFDVTREDFLSRASCRLLLFPSGAALERPLSEEPASMIFGKLLYGGVTRSRLLPSSSSSSSVPRPVSVRQALQSSSSSSTNQKNAPTVPPAWIMYGGPDRMYQSVDMGPAAVLEVILLPRAAAKSNSVDKPTTTSTSASSEATNNNNNNNNNNAIMTIQGFGWSPHNWLTAISESTTDSNDDEDDTGHPDKVGEGGSPTLLSGRAKNDAFRNSFQSSVGGLQPQIDAIVRRVLDGRIIRPADPDDLQRQQQNGLDEKDDSDDAPDRIAQELAANALEAEELALIGLTPVRGLLLYGPPGCGKTALAREISRALRARAPKIVSAPELLDRWVGGSEKLVRSLFADAEAELAACNGDATRSALHVVVIDEIDAVFRHRTSADDSGESTRSSVVNQILAKLDGVNSIPNLLLIGMTNRRELIDSALLRPGRLEVQIEIPLPDREGRREILQIHFGALRERGRLSRQLCCAIDGAPVSSDDGDITLEDESRMTNSVEIETLPAAGGRGGKRAAFKKSLRRLAKSLVKNGGGGGRHYDLAADYATGGFSGAEIAGLVRCAGSIALARSREDGSGIEGLLVTLEDVKLALEEVRDE